MTPINESYTRNKQKKKTGYWRSAWGSASSARTATVELITPSARSADSSFTSSYQAIPNNTRLYLHNNVYSQWLDRACYAKQHQQSYLYNYYLPLVARPVTGNNCTKTHWRSVSLFYLYDSLV